LAICIIEKSVYINQATPFIRQLKMDTFGHDLVILHERDIRKRKGAFRLMDKEAREELMQEMGEIIKKIDFTMIAAIIQKDRLRTQYTTPINPYHLAMIFGLERVYRFLNEKDQSDKKTHFIFEARGKDVDHTLELEFRRVADGKNYFRKVLPFEIIIADKKANLEGLQLVDMIARPVGLSVLRPDQPNRAMEIIKDKFYKDGYGRKNGFGLKVFP
jgi:hypothetical protein